MAYVEEVTVDGTKVDIQGRNWKEDSARQALAEERRAQSWRSRIRGQIEELAGVLLDMDPGDGDYKLVSDAHVALVTAYRSATRGK